MKKIFLMVILVVSLFAKEEVEFYKTSYDCTKTQEKSVAYRVCKKQDLAKEDLKLSRVWKSFRVITKELKKEQLKWLKQKNSCKTKECIQETYKTRIAILKQRLSNHNTYPEKLLNLMKKTEEAVKREFPESKEKQVFFKDLYTFKNMSVSKPILYKVDYNNTKLQKLLGKDCVKMRLDFHIGLVKKYKPRGESTRGVLEYHANSANNYSLYKVDMDGDKQDEIMFIQHFHTLHYYNIIDKNECKNVSFISFPINCTDCNFECQKKSYPDIYYFYNNNGKIIHPYCTLKQKILGVKQISSSSNTIISVVRWKEKSYLVKISDYTNSYNPQITIMLFGTKKLDYLTSQNFIMKKISNKGKMK